ncbi:MAG: hypothetical protein JXA21_19235 [Anaerolineae bacterium]|nr:hypothetical protein [Anaerolineae bacterium]
MTLALILVILGIALYLSMMAFAVALPIRPEIVRVTERFVCPAGARMEVNPAKLGYHRPGERGIVVKCYGQGKTEYVNARALLYLWAIFLVPSLPAAVTLGILASRWIAK